MTPTQQALINNLVNIQKPDLYEIVDRRKDLSTQFRRFIAGQPVSVTEVLSLATRYGELDGEIVYNIATNLAAISRTLTTSQRAALDGLRQQILNGFPLTPEPNAYLYSDQIAMPMIANTDFLFLPALTHRIYLPLVGVNIGASITPTLTLSPTLPDTGQVTDYTSTFRRRCRLLDQPACLRSQRRRHGHRSSHRTHVIKVRKCCNIFQEKKS